jgi:hypothetical protein
VLGLFDGPGLLAGGHVEVAGHLLEAVRAEDVGQQRFTLGGAGPQHLLEAALGQQDDPPELVDVETQAGAEDGVDIGDLGGHHVGTAGALALEHRLGGRLDGGAVALGAPARGLAAHGPLLAPEAEAQLDAGHRPPGVVGVET